MDTALDTNSEIYQEQKVLLESQSWYHHSLSREDAEAFIRRNGEFLVRESTHKQGEFVLSTKWNGRFLHMRIMNRTISAGDNTITKCFTLGEYDQSSIVELIRFHWINQLPMSRDSEAIICRPVLFSAYVPRLEVTSSLLPAVVEAGKKGGSKTGDCRITASGTTGSMYNLATRVAKFTKEVPRRGASITDLRCQSYVEPESLGFNPLHSEELNATNDRSDQSSLFMAATLPIRKTSGINRKQIRYVEMSDAPPMFPANNIAAHKSLSINHLNVIPKLMKSNGCTNYDLTRPLPPDLVELIGQPERALDDKVWKRVSAIFSGQHQRSFTPLNYAGHLALELIHLVTNSARFSRSRHSDCLPTQTDISPFTLMVKRDLLIRDQILYLFVITTVLFSVGREERLNVVKFWLEVAQCSNTIFRDQHDLNAILGALFSPQLRELKSLWDDLKSCGKFDEKLLEEWRSHYVAIGGTHYPVANCDEISATKVNFGTQIPNLIPLFLRDKGTSTIASLHLTVTDNSWIDELMSTWKDQDPLLTALVRSETILTLLIGPIKLERGPALDALQRKLDHVLMEICKVIQST